MFHPLRVYERGSAGPSRHKQKPPINVVFEFVLELNHVGRQFTSRALFRRQKVDEPAGWKTLSGDAFGRKL